MFFYPALQLKRKPQAKTIFLMAQLNFYKIWQRCMDKDYLMKKALQLKFYLNPTVFSHQRWWILHFYQLHRITLIFVVLQAPSTTTHIINGCRLNGNQGWHCWSLSSVLAQLGKRIQATIYKNLSFMRIYQLELYITEENLSCHHCFKHYLATLSLSKLGDQQWQNELIADLTNNTHVLTNSLICLIKTNQQNRTRRNTHLIADNELRGFHLLMWRTLATSDWTLIHRCCSWCPSSLITCTSK